MDDVVAIYITHSPTTHTTYYQEDLRYLGLSSSALFLDSFVSQEYDRLPPFEGTELPERPPEEENDDDEEEGCGIDRGQRAVEEVGGLTGRLKRALLLFDPAFIQYPLQSPTATTPTTGRQDPAAARDLG
jgi:hypothetical protein